MRAAVEAARSARPQSAAAPQPLRLVAPQPQLRVQGKQQRERPSQQCAAALQAQQKSALPQQSARRHKPVWQSF